MGTFTLQHLPWHHSVTTITNTQCPIQNSHPLFLRWRNHSIATVIFHFKSLELEELVSDNHLPTGRRRTEEEMQEREMQADREMEKEKTNWTTSLHEQTHLKPHEWWQQDGRVTEWAKVHAFISLIYLTGVVFHPEPCHNNWDKR